MQILQSMSSDGRSRVVHHADVRVGDRVRARRQRWLVAGVREFDDCALVTLTGLGATNLGVEERLLTPFDRLERLAVGRRLRLVSRARWRHACRALLTSDGSSAILQTALSARMDLLPHQLEPALAVAQGLGSRMLLADDVGLGKTVQAGLVVAELLARAAASRVLVLAPAGLREQWADELSARFGLALALLDMREVKRRQRTLPVGVNPWSTESMAITSMDYIKRLDVLPAVLGCRWDVVVVDEAHGAATGSDRHEAVAALCRLAPHVLLLTATPHNGDAKAFASLCGIGAHGDELLVFRRTRRELGLEARRRIHRLEVRPTESERRMHACLARFANAVERDHGDRIPDIALALATLRKRALSSAFALERSVQRRLAHLADGTADQGLQLQLPIDDRDGEMDAADDCPRWAVPVLQNPREERRLLGTLADAAHLASLRESKLEALKRLLRRLGEPAVVFTEYRDTLAHVRDVVVPGAAVLHGGLSRDERRAALSRLAGGSVLLATDAAGEGLNLHHRCRIVINLELPWNPMRLEQRIGRVDRIGQQQRVHAFHLIARGTGEVRVLERLALRVARARADIGAADPLGTNDVSDSASSGTQVRLAAEAAKEHERLVWARALALRSHGEMRGIADGGPFALFARRHRLRTRLGSRILGLFQATLRDCTGRTVASHLTSVLLRGGAMGTQSLAEFDAIAEHLADLRLPLWREETLAVHRTFWRTRVERELAIAGWLAGRATAALQPGLFDLRAEQERLGESVRRRDAIEEGRRHADTAKRLAPLTFHPPATVLVLLP